MLIVVVDVVVARSGSADFISPREAGARNEASKSLRSRFAKGLASIIVFSLGMQSNFCGTAATTLLTHVSRHSSFIVLLKGRIIIMSVHDKLLQSSNEFPRSLSKITMTNLIRSF